MAIEVEYSSEPGYLLVKVRGRWTEEPMKRGLDEALAWLLDEPAVRPRPRDPQ